MLDLMHSYIRIGIDTARAISKFNEKWTDHVLVGQWTIEVELFNPTLWEPGMREHRKNQAG